MENFQYLLHGFNVALQPIYLFYCFLGVLTGTLIGLLPAIGPVAAVALLLPTAFHLDPIGAIILLAGINYGAMYGGSTTSILVNVPGESSSILTCLDGYPMALKGRAGPALGMAAFGSFIAGTLSIFGLIFLATTLSRLALNFGSPEYTTLMLMSLTVVTYMVRGNMLKAMMMVSCGLILSSVGMDIISSRIRFTYNILSLQDGISIIPLVIGLFGIREVLHNFQTSSSGDVIQKKITGYLPTLQDWKDSIVPIFRSGALGFFMGILPGISPMVPTFISYGLEKKFSKHPEKFGTGVIEGVAGPEACNNATVCGTQVPLFSLGIPTNVMNTLLLSALMIFGMTPGPQFITNNPDLFWGLIASMYIGNALLLVLNLPLIPLWIRVLRIPTTLLNILILLFCFIGAYAINHYISDLYILIVFGLIGYLSKKFSYEPAPLILAFVLGPLIEVSLRQSLIFSDGSFTIFITRPISAIFLFIALFVIISAIFSKKKVTEKYFKNRKDSNNIKIGYGDKATGSFMLLFAIYVIQGSFKLDMGTFMEPGPGFFPMLASISLACMSLIFLVRSFSTKSVPQKKTRQEKSPLIIFIFIGIVSYVLVFKWLGYAISSFLLVIFLFKLLNRNKSWTRIIFTAGIISSLSYILFNVLLKSELPEGILGLF